MQSAGKKYSNKEQLLKYRKKFNEPLFYGFQKHILFKFDKQNGKYFNFKEGEWKTGLLYGYMWHIAIVGFVLLMQG